MMKREIWSVELTHEAKSIFKGLMEDIGFKDYGEVISQAISVLREIVDELKINKTESSWVRLECAELKALLDKKRGVE